MSMNIRVFITVVNTPHKKTTNYTVSNFNMSGLEPVPPRKRSDLPEIPLLLGR
jgi:hypothetical protein